MIITFRWPTLSHAVVNLDDTFGCELAQRWKHRRSALLGYGFDRRSGRLRTPSVEGRNLRVGLDGISFDIASPWGRATLESPLIGRFNVGGSAVTGRSMQAPHLHIVPSTPATSVASAPEPAVARKSPGQWNVKAATAKTRPVSSPALALSEKLAGALGVRQEKGNDGDWEEF